MTASTFLSHRARWIAVALGLAAALAGGWGWRAQAASRVFRVLLLEPELPSDGHLNPRECAAINILVKDQLELVAGASISQTLGIPDASSWSGLRKDALVLRLAPRRVGERLVLGASWIRVDELPRTGAWHRREPAGVAPAEAIADLVGALPLPRRKASPAQLVPRAPAVFWNYLAAQGGAPGGDFAKGKALLDACAAAEPECATLPIAQGELQFFQALQAASHDADGLRAAEAHLQRGLELCPHHPRGTWLLSRLRTDTGSSKEALERLIEARRVHPHALPLLLGITYAGRYAGLLEFAAEAETRTDELSADPRRPTRLQVTFLYRGDWDRYERTLWTRPGDITNSTVLLFRGQLALARGRREEALAAFREASESPVGYSQFLRLGRVFRLVLEGDRATARAELDALAESRVGLRVPDGEFILHMAEAYALLDDLPRAQELAERAFYTGFTCVRWFETNPMLKPLHGTARWVALMQHVKERQAILEARFPPGRWGL